MGEKFHRGRVGGELGLRKRNHHRTVLTCMHHQSKIYFINYTSLMNFQILKITPILRLSNYRFRPKYNIHAMAVNKIA